jgi:hypothetical protein
LSSRATAKVAAAKTAKLEADKKKRKRKASPPPTIPTLMSKEVEEEVDEATNIPPIVDNRVAPRSPSPATKRQQELGQQMIEEDLRRMREAQQAVAGAQAKMPVKIRVWPQRLQLHAPYCCVIYYIGEIVAGQTQYLRAPWVLKVLTHGQRHSSMRSELRVRSATWEHRLPHL